MSAQGNNMQAHSTSVVSHLLSPSFRLHLQGEPNQQTIGPWARPTPNKQTECGHIPVHKQRKFSTVLGTVSLNSSNTSLPAVQTQQKQQPTTTPIRTLIKHGAKGHAVQGNTNTLWRPHHIMRDKLCVHDREHSPSRPPMLI